MPFLSSQEVDLAALVEHQGQYAYPTPNTFIPSHPTSNNYQILGVVERGYQDPDSYDNGYHAKSTLAPYLAQSAPHAVLSPVSTCTGSGNHHEINSFSDVDYSNQAFVGGQHYGIALMNQGNNNHDCIDGFNQANAESQYDGLTYNDRQINHAIGPNRHTQEDVGYNNGSSIHTIGSVDKLQSYSICGIEALCTDTSNTGIGPTAGSGPHWAQTYGSGMTIDSNTNSDSRKVVNLDRRHRHQSSNSSNGATRSVCPTCSKTFGRLSDLERHSKLHQPDAPVFHCVAPGCGYSSKRSDKLAEHVRRVHHP